MSRKANKLKARLRIETNRQQRWLARSNEATARAEHYKQVAHLAITKFGRFIQVDRSRDDEVLCVRYAITRREYEALRFRPEFVQAVTERCLYQLERAIDGAEAETELYS